MTCARSPYPATLPRPTASVGCARRAWPEPCTPAPARPACATHRHPSGPASTAGSLVTFAGPATAGPALDLAGPAGTTGSINPPAGPAEAAVVGTGAVATCVRPAGDARPALTFAGPVPGEATDRPGSAAPTTRRLPAVAVEGPDSACFPSSSTRGDIPASAERPGARR